MSDEPLDVTSFYYLGKQIRVIMLKDTTASSHPYVKVFGFKVKARMLDSLFIRWAKVGYART